MGKSGVPGMQVMPPTRVHTPASISMAAAESGADGMIVMWVTDAETTTSYVPPTVISGGSSYTSGTFTGVRLTALIFDPRDQPLNYRSSWLVPRSSS